MREPPGGHREIQVVAAVCRRADQVLLVQQQGPDDVHPAWSLPGGVVEAGELLTEALAREVREECGLEIAGAGDLLYTVHVQAAPPTANSFEEGENLERTTVFVFEITKWDGEPRPGDPDELVQEARFISLREAVEKLEQHSQRVMREPIVAFLRGSAAVGTVWEYRRQAANSYELVSRIGAWRDVPAKAAQQQGPESDISADRARALFVLGCLVLLVAVLAVLVIGVITVLHRGR